MPADAEVSRSAAQTYYGRHGARLKHPARKALRPATRFAHAARLLRAGDRASACWFLTAPMAES